MTDTTPVPPTTPKNGGLARPFIISMITIVVSVSIPSLVAAYTFGRMEQRIIYAEEKLKEHEAGGHPETVLDEIQAVAAEVSVINLRMQNFERQLDEHRRERWRGSSTEQDME